MNGNRNETGTMILKYGSYQHVAETVLPDGRKAFFGFAGSLEEVKGLAARTLITIAGKLDQDEQPPDEPLIIEPK